MAERYQANCIVATTRYALPVWHQTHGVRVYRFQLFNEGGKVPLVDQPGLSEPQMTLTDLPPGTYGWRVSAVRFKGGTFAEKVGPMQTLQIGR